MGGNAFCGGNASPAAEANILNDPEAADIVFGADCPIVMAGLDVTEKTVMTSADLAAFASFGNARAQHLAKIIPFYQRFYRQRLGLDGIFVHDSTTDQLPVGTGVVRVGRASDTRRLRPQRLPRQDPDRPRTSATTSRHGADDGRCESSPGSTAGPSLNWNWSGFGDDASSKTSVDRNKEETMPLDGQVEGLLAQMAALGKPPIPQQSVEEARAGAEDMVKLAGEPIPVGSVRDITIPVDGAEIGARVYTPEGAGPHPVVVFFHGGGWVICSLDTHDNVARTICRDADAIVVSVDYRMAPEHRFPTAPHDCFAATRWVADNAASLGGDATRLAVCGDSAGGNLSAVVSQMARDAGGPAIDVRGADLPGVDMTRSGGSMVENAKGYFLEHDDMDWFMNHYLSEQDRSNPLASPMLHATWRVCRRASSRPANSIRSATRARRTVPPFGPTASTPRTSATTA